MTAVPTTAQLGAALKRMSESAQRAGDIYRWRPASESVAEGEWLAAANEKASLERTLVEADVAATLLLRASLEHATATATAITANRPYLPLSVGRTALEHALRAAYLIESDVSPLVRAERRLDDWLDALEESRRRREGIVKSGHSHADEIVDEVEALERVEARASALGLTFTPARRGRAATVTAGRPTTMALAEKLLSHSAAGMSSYLLRSHAAVAHGTEFGLLHATVENYDLSTGVNVFRPQALPAGERAFGLMGVALSVRNAFRAVARRYDWSHETREWRNFAKADEQLLTVWEAAVTDYLDETAPDRPRTGIFARVTLDSGDA